MLQSASADSKTANARRSSGSVRSTATVPITPIAAPSNHAMLRLQRKCECGGQPGCDCDSTRDKEKHGGSLHRMPAAGPAPAAPAHNPTPRPGQTWTQPRRLFSRRAFSLPATAKPDSGIRIPRFGSARSTTRWSGRRTVLRIALWDALLPPAWEGFSVQH